MTWAEGAVLVGATLVHTTAIMHWTRRERQAVCTEFAKEYGAPSDGRATREVIWDLAALVIGIAVSDRGRGRLARGRFSLSVGERTLAMAQTFVHRASWEPSASPGDTG